MTYLQPCQITQMAEAKPEEDVKQILILGETGCGKRTLINSIINVLFKIEQSNQFRFKVIDNELQTGSSATDTIQGYRVEVKHSSYSYVFWNTPGYFNTRGFQFDMETSKSISQLLHNIQQLHAVVIVEKYTELLTNKSTIKAKQLKKYLFNQMLSYFGEDVKPYVHLFLTFPSHYEDAQPDLSNYSFPFLPEQVYTINNTVMFERGPVNAHMSKIIWDKNVNLIERFIDKLHDRQALDLTLSVDAILEQTHHLDVTCRMFLSCIDEMRDSKKYKVLERKKMETERCIEVNTDFDTKETITTKMSIPTKNRTTYCRVCEFTCHDDCPTEQTTDVHCCEVFDKDGNCQNCPNKCPANIHCHHPYKIEVKHTTKENTNYEKRVCFYQASNKLKYIETQISNLGKEYVKFSDEALQRQKEVQLAIMGLNRVAPYFDVHSTYNYLGLTIHQKKSRHKHLTQFEIETFLLQHAIVRISQSTPQADSTESPEKELDSLKSEIIALEENMSVTSCFSKHLAV